jgi:hypothetical protein
VSLDILDIVELRRQRVLDIDNDNLPVRLLFIEQRHDAENLDLLDLAGLADKLANLTHVERVVVAFGFGLGVNDVGVFPGLGEGAIVPEVAFVREAVADEAELALFDVLFNGVEGLFFGDLEPLRWQMLVTTSNAIIEEGWSGKL